MSTISAAPLRGITAAPLRGIKVSVAALVLAGCAASPFGSSSVVQQSADQRVVVSTPVDNWYPGRVRPKTVICSEPSPDVAKLVSSNFDFQVKLAASLPAGISPSAAFSFAKAQSESIAALTKRLATIQLLRDGTFRACEAYRNGAISDTVYAVIVAHTERAMIGLLTAELVAERDSSGYDGTLTLAAPPLRAEEVNGMIEEVDTAVNLRTEIRGLQAAVDKLLPNGAGLAGVLGAPGAVTKGLSAELRQKLGQLLGKQQELDARNELLTKKSLPKLRERLRDDLGAVGGIAAALIPPRARPTDAAQPARRPREATAKPAAPSSAPAISAIPAIGDSDAVKTARIMALAGMEAVALVYPTLAGVEMACINTLDRQPIVTQRGTFLDTQVPGAMLAKDPKSNQVVYGSGTTLLQRLCYERLLGDVVDHKKERQQALGAGTKDLLDELIEQRHSGQNGGPQTTLATKK